MAVARVRLGSPAVKARPLEGFGAQFNTNIFTRGGQDRDLTQAQHADLQAAITDLRPGHSRIFIRRGLRPDTPAGRSAPEFVALMSTIELAQKAGANVNLTWWGQGPYANEGRLRALDWPNRTFRKFPDPSRRKWPKELVNLEAPGALTAPKTQMQRFARIILEARARGLRCVTHATIQNEPNQGRTDLAKQGDQFLSMRLYELLYRHLHEALEALPDPDDPTQSRSLRQSVRLVAGDLVEQGNSAQDDWLAYLHANMEVPREGFASVLDGYSIHVYWEPGGGPAGFPQKLESRLEKLKATTKRLRLDKPMYVTEYGVRVATARPKPGKLDGRPLEQSPEIAFQHAWFNALAPQYGCVGLAKWVLYRTDNRAEFGDWGMIDQPRAGFTRFPTYRVTRLFNHLVGPGWTAAGFGRAAAAGVLGSRFAGPQGAESVVVLNNGPGQEVRIEGLTKSRRYATADWNADGKGTVRKLGPATADAAGTASITVPRHGLVALSSRPLAL